ALKMMLVPFKIGVGGKIGNGQQYVSWIAIDDVLGAVGHVQTNPVIHGPVNIVSPYPITNLEFTQTLGKVLGRPTILPMPGFAAKLAFGEMANDLLLASQRVEPGVLVNTQFTFRYPRLEHAL